MTRFFHSSTNALFYMYLSFAARKQAHTTHTRILHVLFCCKTTATAAATAATTIHTQGNFAVFFFYREEKTDSYRYIEKDTQTILLKRWLRQQLYAKRSTSSCIAEHQPHRLRGMHVCFCMCVCVPYVGDVYAWNSFEPDTCSDGDGTRQLFHMMRIRSYARQ